MDSRQSNAAGEVRQLWSRREPKPYLKRPYRSDRGAKRENLNPDEAAIALTKIEDEFWAYKTGQKLIRDRVERSFPEFIARVPAGLLGDSGLKRHYKLPEPVKVLRGERKMS